MKQVAGQLRLDLAQYRELAAFAQFGSDLDKITQMRLSRGQRTMEILKQQQYHTLPVEEEVVVIYAAVKGLIDDIEVDQIGRFEQEYLRYMRSVKADLLARIRSEKALSDELNKEVEKAITEFKQGFLA